MSHGGRRFGVAAAMLSDKNVGVKEAANISHARKLLSYRTRSKNGQRFKRS
jgi:hypothetical protein